MTPAGSSSLNPLVLEVTYDQAYEEVDRLQNRTMKETSGVTLYTGTHPSLGDIHIIIPMMGNGMMMVTKGNAFASEFAPKPTIIPVIPEELPSSVPS